MACQSKLKFSNCSRESHNADPAVASSTPTRLESKKFMNSAKNLFLSVGALLSFLIFILLFGLIFYKLFGGSGGGEFSGDQAKNIRKISSISPSSNKESSTKNRPSVTNKTNILSNWRGFKRLWKTNNELERAQLLVQNVNLNPNSTWSARLNKYTIG
uniref:Uncharacterized protein n=1 Tax=Meloidogyne hapla TaxID=6305 RepID=A0A1I8BRS9_MELHA